MNIRTILRVSLACFAACSLMSAMPAEAKLTTKIVPDAQFEDYDSDVSPVIDDPIEPWNRFWFTFNDFVIMRMVKPTYQVYSVAVPSPLRDGLLNATNNAMFPVRFVSCLLQGKLAAAGVEMGRFIVNTTVGFGGFADVASRNEPVVPMDPVGEDIGQTLGYWGIGDGIYIVWPLWGPSTARDTVGMVSDGFLEPLSYITPFSVNLTTQGVTRFNRLEGIIDIYESMRDSSVDPYISMRESYINYRRNHVNQ